MSCGLVFSSEISVKKVKEVATTGSFCRLRQWDLCCFGGSHKDILMNDEWVTQA